MDIANAADIDRKTFYSHYSGVYAVVESVENEIVSSFDEGITGMSPIKALMFTMAG